MALTKISGTEVKVRADGVVLHRHPKANDPEGKSWHPAKEMHKDAATHDRVKAKTPANLSILTPEQKKDYLELNLQGLEPAWATKDWEDKKAVAKAKKEAAAALERATAEAEA